MKSSEQGINVPKPKNVRWCDDFMIFHDQKLVPGPITMYVYILKRPLEDEHIAWLLYDVYVPIFRMPSHFARSDYV